MDWPHLQNAIIGYSKDGLRWTPGIKRSRDRPKETWREELAGWKMGHVIQLAKDKTNAVLWLKPQAWACSKKID